MADNFNLRAFLSENKLTKNAKLLKEEESQHTPEEKLYYEIVEQLDIAGLTGKVTVALHSTHGMPKPEFQVMNADDAAWMIAEAVVKAKAVDDILFAQGDEIDQQGELDPETEGLECRLEIAIVDVGKYEIYQGSNNGSNATEEPDETLEEMYGGYDDQYPLASYTSGGSNRKEEPKTPPQPEKKSFLQKAKEKLGFNESEEQGTDVSGYWVMYGGLNKEIKEFIAMFPSQEEAQQALENAPTKYGQHVLRGYWGIIPVQEWLASGRKIGKELTGHPDRIIPKRLSPEEEKASRQRSFNDRMEREGTENKKPIMKETKLTAKERRLVEMVNNAMGYQEEGEDEFNPADAADEEDYRRDQYRGNQMEEGDEMPDETVIPAFNTIEELMKEIEMRTKKTADEAKIEEMKNIAEAMRRKLTGLEEGEHADHLDKKKLTDLRKNIGILDKTVMKLKTIFDKTYNKDQKKGTASKKETPAEEPATLAEGTFDLRKFLAENRKK